MVFKSKTGRITAEKPKHSYMISNARFVFNVGSVGQSRDGVNVASYCVFDTKKKLVEFNRIRYNINSVKEKIRKRGLVEILALRLGQGR